MRSFSIRAAAASAVAMAAALGLAATAPAGTAAASARPAARAASAGMVVRAGPLVRPAAARRAAPGRYRVTELGSLGGTASVGNSINNRGWIAGTSALPGNGTIEAALWRGGRLTPLGTLGGPNSAVLWPVHATNGVLVGVSETAQTNPLGEDWSCSAFFPQPVTHHVCVGFWWRRGHMHALPTFGGPDGFATAVNNRGLAVGWAENTVRDPTCRAPQVLQFRAALWNLRRGTIRQLRPLPNDSTTAANAINDRGEVVGISGSCDVAVGAYSARHAVVWRHGRVSRLPTLGVPAWNTPMELNNAGVVVGFVNAPTPGQSPATQNLRAALWTPRGALHILRTLPGFATSDAAGVNDRGQAVGDSCPASLALLCHAVVWQHGRAYDLNSLVSAGHGLVLEVAGDINDSGVITGEAYDEASGATVAFRATPVPCARGSSR